MTERQGTRAPPRPPTRPLSPDGLLGLVRLLGCERWALVASDLHRLAKAPARDQLDDPLHDLAERERKAHPPRGDDPSRALGDAALERIDRRPHGRDGQM